MAERPTYVPPELPESMPRRNRRRPARDAERAALRTKRAAPAAPVRPRIVSSAHGPLRHVMLWYPPETGSFRPYRAAYGDLLRLLPATTRVTMVVHPDSLADAEALAGEAVGDVELVTTPDWLGFSVWAEDACVVVEDLDSEADAPITYLVEPFEFLRAGDQIVADLVAQATTLQSTQLPLMFQGGNILIGDDFVLVGRDYLDESVDKAIAIGHIDGFPERGSRDAQESFVRDLFRRTFDPDRDVHFLESDPRGRVSDSVVEEDGRLIYDEVETGRGPRQPIFHIDMFVSLAGHDPATGRYRVLVGDPRLADEILEWDSVAHDMASEFDDIADQLGRLDFAVQRTPLPYVPSIDERPGRVQLPDGTTVRFDARRRWYHATTNNCLVQIDGETRDVWLPTYGHGVQRALEATDRSHRRTWEELGFAVHQLGDFNAFAYNLGALHCIKKYLAR
jgi:hypothetical protein